jgi:hypothetical protein
MIHDILIGLLLPAAVLVIACFTGGLLAKVRRRDSKPYRGREANWDRPEGGK